MINKIYQRSFWVLIVFIFFTVITEFRAHAVNRIVDLVDIEQSQEGSVIHITFNLRFQYVSHNPIKSGNVLEVRLRPLSSDTSEFQLRESLIWTPDKTLPLSEIIYEGRDPLGPKITLQFTKEIPFLVRGNSDLRGIDVTVQMDREPETDLIKSKKKVDGQGVAEKVSIEPAKEVKEKEILEIIESPEQSDLTIMEKAEMEHAPIIEQADWYAINLESAIKSIDRMTLPDLQIFEKYLLYDTEIEKNGILWFRLRLGFFPTRQAAREVLEQLREDFPSAWITKVDGKSALEIEHAAGKDYKPIQVIKPTDRKQKPPPGVSVTVDEVHDLPRLSEERKMSLLEEAKVVMTSGDYRRGIQIYTKLLQASDEKVRQEAQELLGLAREKNKQFAHAKAEYEKYLRLYPEEEGAQRVKQRLDGLLTAVAEPKPKLREAKKMKQETGIQKEFYGTFSQFYFRDETFTDLQGDILNISSLTNDLDFSSRVRSNDYDIRTLFVGGYEKDFRDESEDETRISSLYLNGMLKTIGLSGRIGRQSLSTSGVLGRFDGGILSYQIIPEITANALFGYPVNSTRDGLHTDKQFYGISFDLGTFNNRWDFNTFFINQDADGPTDRRAVGGEVRYFDQKASFFTLVDYDILFETLNLFVFTGNYIFPNRTTLNFSADYRQSPLLTTSNAIQGQGVDTLSDLEPLFTEEELQNLARDRTATSRSLTVGVTHPLNKKLQVSGDFTATKLSGTVASGGVEGNPETDYEFFYSTQLIGSNLIKDGDISILGLRYSDTTNYDSTAINLNTRYPITRGFRVNPRVQFDYRSNKDDNGEQFTTRTSIRIDYKWKKFLRFELEGGGEWSTDEISAETDRTKGYFVSLGYRYDF